MLVLIIVYATNFFKDFFFEAIVTVNLTSLLVLTTLFISVAGSLPQTVKRVSKHEIDVIRYLIQAYIKMVDIWLIFAQVKLLAWITSNVVCWVFFVVDVAMHYISLLSG